MNSSRSLWDQATTSQKWISQGLARMELSSVNWRHKEVQHLELWIEPCQGQESTISPVNRFKWSRSRIWCSMKLSTRRTVEQETSTYLPKSWPSANQAIIREKRKKNTCKQKQKSKPSADQVNIRCKRSTPRSNPRRGRNSFSSSIQPRIGLVMRWGAIWWSAQAHMKSIETWTVQDTAHKDSTQQLSLESDLRTYLVTKISLALEITVTTIQWTVPSQARHGHQLYKHLAQLRKEWAKWVTAFHTPYLDQELTQVRGIVSLQLVQSCSESEVN